uniref:EF-hand domain-containing protein 1 n=1 Tax=Pyrodinium bahamense TaxID=73915 RepID=A0A7S0B7I4_9DINO
MAAADLRLLPNLPGFSYPHFKDNYAKNQTWNVVNSQRVEQQHGVTHEKPKFVKAARPQDHWRTGSSMPDSTTRANFKANVSMSAHTELPAWDAFDRHVLRFYGYFKEAVVESNLENHRVRKVYLLYYLEDDTCHVMEPRQDNSGIPQGQLIRRHRFPAPGGGYIMPEDLQVGQTLHVYGKAIVLTDCDEFTRSYYSQAGREQAGPVPEETDPFMQTRQAIKVTTAAQPRTYEKLYREVMLGGGHVNADMQQFLENDGKVLRFFAVMDDVSTPQFERRPFVILFFLADDTIEIREMYPLNCGRDNFPIFFRKAKMPIGDYRVDGPQSAPRKKSEFVHGHDFAVGMDVTLLGNYHFFIYDADEFTRMYFRDELGSELSPKVSVELPERAVPRAQTPPYTGYGSWDDSMASVTHLIPKAPQKNFNKLYHNDGKILRFKARFANPQPEDTDRLFVVSFNLADDSMSIHEPPQRNLGIVTGKFLEKGIHMNQMTGRLFEPGDLAPGNIIKVYNHEFEMLDMDEYTAKMFADPNTRHVQFDLEAVLQKLRESMRQQYPLVRDIFRRFDSDHDGVMTLAEFKRALEKFGFQLSHDEVVQIMRYFDTRRDGQVSYNEFCDGLLDEDYSKSMLKTKPRLDTRHDESYVDRVHTKTVERVETAEVRKAVRAVGDVLYQKHGILTKIFKEFGHITHLTTVSCEQIQQALRQIGFSFDLEDVQRTVLYVLPGADLACVSYVELFKALNASFHDLAMHR